MFQAWSRSHDV